MYSEIVNIMTGSCGLQRLLLPSSPAEETLATDVYATPDLATNERGTVVLIQVGSEFLSFKTTATNRVYF